MNAARLVTILALLLSAAMAPANAVDWPSVPVPQGARGERVSDHMIYNGLSMSASRFTVDQPIARVRAFYLRQWKDQVADTPMPHGRSVLGHLSGGRYYVTVELTPVGDSTEGQIGVMRLPDRDLSGQVLGKGFERMPQTQVAEDIVYMDTPQRVRSLRLSNAYSPFQNERFYTRRLAAQGYVKTPADTPCAAASDLCQVRYTCGERRITVTAIRARAGSEIVAVLE